jgi:Protein of unknown function (DUF3570)
VRARTRGALVVLAAVIGSFIATTSRAEDALGEAAAGRAAERSGDFDACIAHDRASLAITPYSRVRLHLAACEIRTKKLVDGLRDANLALKEGIVAGDVRLMEVAKQVVGYLLARLPHVKFVGSDAVEDLTLEVDGTRVDPSLCPERGCPFDPGEHTFQASGMILGKIPGQMRGGFEAREGETTSVSLKLPLPTGVDWDEILCVMRARTPEEQKGCIRTSSPLILHAGFGLSGYSDTEAVRVYSPELSGSIASPTAGWNVAGSMLVDVISAASPDIVSEASPPFHETRYAGTLSGGYKLGRHGPFDSLAARGHAEGSRSPDDESFGGGVELSAELLEKSVAPSVGYTFGRELIGRTDTVNVCIPGQCLHHVFDTHDVDASVTLVLSRTTILVAGGTLTLESGDQSKPYRYIPMFDHETAATVVPGESIAVVNATRLDVRPLENLPTSRIRYAAAARLAHRFAASTLRLEERLYGDSWSQEASTTDARFLVDLGERLRVWPHLRLNAQNGTDFYRLAYAVIPGADGFQLPRYRTNDRELSPLVTVMGGGGLYLELGPPEAKTHYALTLQGDAMYTRFFESIFVLDRLAGFGSLGLDFTFE